ncbi:MAG: hypothetical protein JW794_08505 [Candidatus Cloacimonetes bacterium]|nr:hypothetical protein [Candidatus Cloacimonadota bacterium]
MNSAELLGLLTSIGFTRIEAEVYLSLAQGAAQSGYTISNSIGKSRSNVYQALKTLEQKGAIVELQAGRNKQFQAVPIEQVLEQKEKDFLTKKEAITEAFSSIQNREQDDQIYALNTVSQVYTKAEEMIQSAEEVIFIDVQPMQLERIRSVLEETASRGIKIVILGDETYEVKGCEIMKYSYYVTPGKTYEPWGLDWFCIAVDGGKFLISTFKQQEEELIYALWSSSTFLAGWIYSDMLYEIAFSHIINMFKDGLSREQIWDGINAYAAKYFDIAPAIIRLKALYKDAP